MSDFFTNVVPWVVAIVTIVSVLACGVVLWIQASKKLKVSLDEKTNSHMRIQRLLVFKLQVHGFSKKIILPYQPILTFTSVKKRHRP